MNWMGQMACCRNVDNFNRGTSLAQVCDLTKTGLVIQYNHRTDKLRANEGVKVSYHAIGVAYKILWCIPNYSAADADPSNVKNHYCFQLILSHTFEDEIAVRNPLQTWQNLGNNPGVMTRHYIQGYKHQVISLMIHYMEKNLWYSWREEHSWIEDLSEPDFKRAFDKMELYCDLLIFYGDSTSMRNFTWIRVEAGVKAHFIQFRFWFRAHNENKNKRSRQQRKSLNQFDVVKEPRKESHAAGGEQIRNGSDMWATIDEGKMLILKVSRADLTEHKDKRSDPKMSHSVQHKVIENSKRMDMPPMLKQVPTCSENGVPVLGDPTIHNYRQVFREGFAALLHHPPSDTDYWTEERVCLFRYVYAALRAQVI
ncbi:hypothetical protein KCU85_g6815, partial [Aureobasidium melanogenum]